MLATLNYRQVLRFVDFPVYIVSSEDIWLEDGLLFVGGKILDDKNQPGDTLGKRRLTTEHKLGKLGKACFNFIELIDSKSSKFIDSNGKPFYYEKTKLLDVVSYEIKKKIAKDVCTVLFLKGINFPFIVPRYPHKEDWAQVLVFEGMPWKLYSLSEDKLNTFKRKI